MKKILLLLAAVATLALSSCTKDTPFSLSGTTWQANETYQDYSYNNYGNRYYYSVTETYTLNFLDRTNVTYTYTSTDPGTSNEKSVGTYVYEKGHGAISMIVDGEEWSNTFVVVGDEIMMGDIVLNKVK